VHEQIAANKRKTVLLFVVAIAFTALIGYTIGFLFFQGGVVGVVLATILAVALSLGSYFAGDRIVLASTGAREVTAEQEPRFHNIVEGIAIAAGVPKPRVYVVPEQAPNAFATGRDPEHSSIAVTQGLLDIMNRVELEGVIGHEMSHVLDRDILVGTVVATVVGAAVLMSEFFTRSWFWGGGRMGGRLLAIFGNALRHEAKDDSRRVKQQTVLKIEWRQAILIMGLTSVIPFLPSGPHFPHPRFLSVIAFAR